METAVAIIVLITGFIAWSWWRYYTSDHGAPYVTMDHEVAEAALRLAHITENDVVYDLGSGDGRVPIYAALHYNVHSIGIEIDQLRVLYSKWQVFLLRLGDKVTFLRDNFFHVDLSPATVVIMYLLQETNEALVEKLTKELKPGTRIVSAAFYFPGWQPIAVDEDHPTPWGPLYLYEIGQSNPR